LRSAITHFGAFTAPDNHTLLSGVTGRRGRNIALGRNAVLIDVTFIAGRMLIVIIITASVTMVPDFILYITLAIMVP
jgi:hypothetical protein